MQSLGGTYFSFMKNLVSSQIGTITNPNFPADSTDRKGISNKVHNNSDNFIFNNLLSGREYAQQTLDKLLQLENNPMQKANLCCNKNSGIPGRHGYHQETENIVNDQIYHELNAALKYLAIATHFGRTDVALPGAHGYFFNMHIEEHGHAMVFLNFQLMRGGQVKLKGIEQPDVSIKTIKDAYTTALNMEIFVKEKLTDVMTTAEQHKDLQLQDLITTEFMDEQNKSICELGRLIERSKISDTPLGEYLFDRMVFNSFVKNHYNKLMHKRNLQDREYDVEYK